MAIRKEVMCAMLSTAFTACQRNKSATSSTHRMYEHALTVSEDADDHTPVGFTVPPVGRQLSIDVRHFHQHITDHTDNTHTAWPAHLYSIYIYDMLPLRQSSCEDLLPLRILKILNFPKNLKW